MCSTISIASGFSPERHSVPMRPLPRFVYPLSISKVPALQFFDTHKDRNMHARHTSSGKTVAGAFIHKLPVIQCSTQHGWPTLSPNWQRKLTQKIRRSRTPPPPQHSWSGYNPEHCINVGYGSLPDNKFSPPLTCEM